MITLFKTKADCCGCGACVSICPKNAISFKNDEYGFAYPVIDTELCIECAQCNKVCAFQNNDKENTPLKAYAAAVNDDEKIMKSTSGGAFAVLADEVLNQGGIVFGAAIEKDNDAFTVHHIDIDSTDDLHKILKSKYVQSSTNDGYIKAKQYLDSGKTVLYSGTPCQIAGLKGYLKKDYNNLITADLVCHGVPSPDLFNSYIKQVEQRENITVTGFDFRNKEKGWEHFNKIKGINDDKLKYISFNSDSINYSYMDLFLKRITLRENCYTCKYASANRPADITLGDYWGIGNVHSEWLTENGGALNSDTGISCVILNTQKGIDFFESVRHNFISYESNFDEAASGNTQLRHPADLPENRQEIMDIYKNSGYSKLEQRYQKHLDREDAKAKIKKLVPKKLWNKAKKILKGQ